MNAKVNCVPARQRAAELPHRNLISRLRARPARVLGGLIVPVMLAVLAFGAPAAIGNPLGQITEFSAGLNPGADPVANYSGSIAAGPDGNLWFTDDGTTDAIGRITPSGQITEFSAGLNPSADTVGIAMGPDGNLWFTDQGATKAIGRITPSGQITEFSTGLNAGADPVGIAMGADGNLWFTDDGSPDAIGQITPSGRITEFSTGLNPGAVPVAITAGPDGNLWFTDQGTTDAIGRITPSGRITEFTHPQNPFFDPLGIAAGPDGDVWFADRGDNDAIGQITPSGQITEFTSQQHPTFEPGGITAGQDGDLWFTDDDRTIGRIGSGAPPALDAPASVSGAGAAGSAETCQAKWSDWAGYSPLTALYPFDGYTWLRDGTPIAGQTAPTYTPTAGDVGHQLACRLAVTYPLPYSVTATAASNAITVKPATSQSPTAAPPPAAPPTPALSALHVSPGTFTLAGRRADGRCQPATRSNRRHRPCTRPVKLTVRFTLNTNATVTVRVQRALTARTTRGRCTPPARRDRQNRCSSLQTLPGALAVRGLAGVNSLRLPGVIGGHPLRSGSYRLLATPTTHGRAGNRQHTTFQITR